MVIEHCTGPHCSPVVTLILHDVTRKGVDDVVQRLRQRPLSDTVRAVPFDVPAFGGDGGVVHAIVPFSGSAERTGSVDPAVVARWAVRSLLLWGCHLSPLMMMRSIPESISSLVKVTIMVNKG